MHHMCPTNRVENIWKWILNKEERMEERVVQGGIMCAPGRLHLLGKTSDCGIGEQKASFSPDMPGQIR